MVRSFACSNICQHVNYFKITAHFTDKQGKYTAWDLRRKVINRQIPNVPLKVNEDLEKAVEYLIILT